MWFYPRRRSGNDGGRVVVSAGVGGVGVGGGVAVAAASYLLRFDGSWINTTQAQIWI